MLQHHLPNVAPHTHTHTHTHTQPFYGSLDFVWDNPGEPVPEETFTHSPNIAPQVNSMCCP